MRREKEIKKTFDRYDMDVYESLSEFIEFLIEEFNKIPEEYRAKAKFEIDPNDSYGDPSYKINITYNRPETDKEATRREKIDRNCQELEARKERKTYELLKQKYEG